ncbi:helix-turn-helix domain-containing protein [Breznakiellaceae bacterium SP9]
MKNDIVSRFIEVRKKYGPTQAKFGKLLGFSDGSISMIESGKIAISEKHIKHICASFGINEGWFRTGEEVMLVEEVPDTKELLEVFRKLSPEGRKLSIKLIDALFEAELEKGQSQTAEKTPPDTVP